MRRAGGAELPPHRHWARSISPLKRPRRIKHIYLKYTLSMQRNLCALCC